MVLYSGGGGGGGVQAGLSAPPSSSSSSHTINVRRTKTDLENHGDYQYLRPLCGRMSNSVGSDCDVNVWIPPTYLQLVSV